MAMKEMTTWSIVVALLTVAASAAAQIRYVDSAGVVHWVQSPAQIPPEYREKAEQPKLPEIDAAKGEDPNARARRKAFETDRTREQERAEREQAREAVDASSSARFRAAAEECKRRARLQGFVKPDDSVENFGTQKQHFEFHKCMNDRGVPTDPVR